jgi:hypothetical protein
MKVQFASLQDSRPLPLIRPSGTFSHQEGREKAFVIIAFSSFFQREKVAEGRMRDSDV